MKQVLCILAVLALLLCLTLVFLRAKVNGGSGNILKDAIAMLPELINGHALGIGLMIVIVCAGLSLFLRGPKWINTVDTVMLAVSVCTLLYGFAASRGIL